VQTIAEGSVVSGTSKNMEMKLTNVARQSGGVAPRLRRLLAATWFAAVAARRSALPTQRSWAMAGEKLLKNQKGGNRARLRPVALDDATARRGA
jgi:hypothetical protein